MGHNSDMGGTTSSQSHGVMPPDVQQGDDFTLLDLLIVAAKYKGILALVPFVAAICALMLSYAFKNIYTAETKILPPQQSQSSTAALLTQFAPVLGNLGGTIKNPNDVYVAMLKSRTVSQALVDRFRLDDVFHSKLPSDARALLARMTDIHSGKDGLITIEVDDTDPKRAALLVNGYVDELRKLTSMLAVGEASQRRLFFERQVAEARERLSQSESAAKQAMESGGLIAVEGQGRSILETTARLRGQITAKEIQISGMRSFASANHPDMLLATRELEAIKHELAKLEGTTSTPQPRSIAQRNIAIENSRLLRDVKYHETLFELLAKQYELAKLDEAKSGAVIQVLDPAIPPDRKSRPKRLTYMMIGGAFGLIAVVLYIWIREALLRVNTNPRLQWRIDHLRRYLRLGSRVS